jgi:hypothetical protein
LIENLTKDNSRSVELPFLATIMACVSDSNQDIRTIARRLIIKSYTYNVGLRHTILDDLHNLDFKEDIRSALLEELHNVDKAQQFTVTKVVRLFSPL